MQTHGINRMHANWNKRPNNERENTTKSNAVSALGRAGRTALLVGILFHEEDRGWLQQSEPVAPSVRITMRFEECDRAGNGVIAIKSQRMIVTRVDV